MKWTVSLRQLSTPAWKRKREGRAGRVATYHSVTFLFGQQNVVQVCIWNTQKDNKPLGNAGNIECSLDRQTRGSNRLTSVLRQQQQVALQHWSPVSFLVEELERAKENTPVCVWMTKATRRRHQFTFNAAFRHSQYIFILLAPWRARVRGTV